MRFAADDVVDHRDEGIETAVSALLAFRETIDLPGQIFHLLGLFGLYSDNRFAQADDASESSLERGVLCFYLNQTLGKLNLIAENELYRSLYIHTSSE